MPVLDNPKYEIFARHLAKGKNQTEAAIEAGYSKSRARHTAYRLLATNGHIALRVEELKAQFAEKACVNASWLLAQAVKLYERCMGDGDKFYPRSAAQALEIIGRHVDVGAFEQKDSNVKPPVVNVEIKNLALVLEPAQLQVLRERIRITGQSAGNAHLAGNDRAGDSLPAGTQV